MTKQDKYTKSARGQECQIRIPGVCNFNPETTVLAHLNGCGVGMKRSNIHGAYACSACHDAVDGRMGYPVRAEHGDYDTNDLVFMHIEGMIRTQELMIKNGILKL